MDLNYLKKLLKVFDDSNAVELSIEEENLKLYFAKNTNPAGMQPPVQSAYIQTGFNAPAHPLPVHVEPASGIEQPSQEKRKKRGDVIINN